MTSNEEKKRILEGLTKLIPADEPLSLKLASISAALDSYRESVVGELRGKIEDLETYGYARKLVSRDKILSIFPDPFKIGVNLWQGQVSYCSETKRKENYHSPVTCGYCIPVGPIEIKAKPPGKNKIALLPPNKETDE